MLLYNTPALWSNVSFEVCDRCVRRSRVCFLLQTLVVRQLSTRSHFTIRNALHWHCGFFCAKQAPSADRVAGVHENGRGLLRLRADCHAVSRRCEFAFADAQLGAEGAMDFGARKGGVRIAEWVRSGQIVFAG